MTIPLARLNLDGARCVGQGDLFASTDIRDHIVARAECDICPAKLACTLALAEAQRLAPAGTGGVDGTWAGELYGLTGHPVDLGAPCGTPDGWRLHRRLKEHPCTPCSSAHNSHRRAVREANKLKAAAS